MQVPCAAPVPDASLSNLKKVLKETQEMAEKTKSATTTAKPRKPAAKKNSGANGASNVTEITATRTQMTVTRELSTEEIAQLAHQLWLEGGRQHGQDADHWFRAEQLLRGKAS